MSMAGLPISTSGGTQSSTQSPQSLVNQGTSTEASSSVQPGTATSLLTTSNGISLGPSQLSTVTIGNGASSSSHTTQTVASASPPKKHTPNYVLLGVAGLLLVVAVVVSIIFTLNAKNTTYSD
jgi:hypothetical protein